MKYLNVSDHINGNIGGDTNGNIGREIPDENSDDSDFSSDGNIPLKQMKSYALFTPVKNDGEPEPSSSSRIVKGKLFTSKGTSPSCSKSKSDTSLWKIRPLPTINRPVQNNKKTLSERNYWHSHKKSIRRERQVSKTEGRKWA